MGPSSARCGCGLTSVHGTNPVRRSSTSNSKLLTYPTDGKDSRQPGSPRVTIAFFVRPVKHPTTKCSFRRFLSFKIWAKNLTVEEGNRRSKVPSSSHDCFLRPTSDTPRTQLLLPRFVSLNNEAKPFDSRRFLIYSIPRAFSSRYLLMAFTESSWGGVSIVWMP